MTRKTLNRRRVLQGAGVGIAASMAGCLPDGGGDGDGTGSGSGNGSGTGNGTDGGDGGDGDPTELPEVHFITDYYTEAWEGLWGEMESGFEEGTGIQVNVEEGGMSGTQEGRLAQLIQAGDPPDANTSTFDQVADIWATDQLEPVGDLVSTIEEVNGEQLSEAFLGEDNIYQVPHGLYISNFQYRADVYDELGLSEPENFQDILDNAQAIEESDYEARGYGVAGAPTGKSQDEFQVILASAGVSGIGVQWSDPDARDELEVYFPEEEVTTVLQFMKDLSQYSPDPTSIGWAESLSQWVQGQYAQCYHLNAWPVGVAAAQAEARDSDALRGLAEATQIMPYPTMEGVAPEENWLSAPAPDGYQIFSNGGNTPGAREWFEWLYADSLERTVGFYATDPGRFVPSYGDVMDSDAFQNLDMHQAHPHLLEKLEYVQDEIWSNHYGNVDEANVSSPEALYLQRQWFYGEMVNRVVTETDTVQEAYEWGLGQLEDALATAKEEFA